MAEKSNEQFQKDILEILKKNAEEIKEFKKEVEKKLETSKTEKTTQAKQVEKKTDFSYICSIVRSTRAATSQEETLRIAGLVSKEISPIMEKYKISKLEGFVIRIYD